MLALAHGSDGGGSIRIPAALCHLFGFKASRGLTPNFFRPLDPIGLATVGALTRHVTDSAAIMDILRGHPPDKPGSLLEACQQPYQNGLRFKMCLESPVTTPHPEVVAGVESVAAILESVGHHVEVVEPIDGELSDFLPIFERLASRAPSLSESHFQPITRWLRARGRKVSAAQAQELADTLRQRLLDWLGDVDFMLTPTTPCFAPAVGAFSGQDPEADFLAAAQLGSYTAPLNASGQPAASVPVGLGGPNQRPFGAQRVAAPGQDANRLRLCHHLQEAMAWNQRMSPMFEA